ncbi:MAG: hypothetical protein ABI416_09010 [Ginsengibacter sp.]
MRKSLLFLQCLNKNKCHAFVTFIVPELLHVVLTFVRVKALVIHKFFSKHLQPYKLEWVIDNNILQPLRNSVIPRLQGSYTMNQE